MSYWLTWRPRSDALAKQQQLRQLFGRPYTVNDQQLTVSASLGLAVFPDNGTSADELLSHADREMYAEKHIRRQSFSDS